MRFVLTGRAEINGQFVQRDDLTYTLNDLGDYTYEDFGGGADVLVASRSDTRKAVQARALGKPVWTYRQLQAYINLRQSGVSAEIARTSVGAEAAAAAVAYGLQASAAAAAVSTQQLGRAVQQAGVTFGRISSGFPDMQSIPKSKPEPAKPHPVPDGHILANGKRMIDL